MIIDKNLFPEEHRAVRRLIENSIRIENERKKKAEQKLKKIEECRRALDEEHTK